MTVPADRKSHPQELRPLTNGTVNNDNPIIRDMKGKIKMLKLEMKLKCETKTCYRFEQHNEGNLITLYLKKTDVDQGGINPKKGITVTVEEGTNHD